MPAATEQPRPAMEAPPHVDATCAVADGAVLPRQEEAEAGAAGGGGRERCPRCASRDTKFCYYNNYNTAQPRHFCRACRRYWTLGGSLRDVPVGGSLRKRPRRPARPTRALAAAAAAAAAVVTTTARTTTTTSPFASSSSPAVLAPASDSSSLFGSLFGTAPLLEGRLGFGLGLGHPGATKMGPFGFGGAEAPLLWSTMILEGDHADTWRAAVEVSSQVAACQELAAAAAPVEAGGLHHGTPPLL